MSILKTSAPKDFNVRLTLRNTTKLVMVKPKRRSIGPFERGEDSRKIIYKNPMLFSPPVQWNNIF